jgi:hypothetical protein
MGGGRGSGGEEMVMITVKIFDEMIVMIEMRMI